MLAELSNGKNGQKRNLKLNLETWFRDFKTVEKKSEFALVGIRIYINWELGNFDNRGIGIKFGGFVGLGWNLKFAIIGSKPWKKHRFGIVGLWKLIWTWKLGTGKNSGFWHLSVLDRFDILRRGKMRSAMFGAYSGIELKMRSDTYFWLKMQFKDDHCEKMVKISSFCADNCCSRLWTGCNGGSENRMWRRNRIWQWNWRIWRRACCLYGEGMLLFSAICGCWQWNFIPILREIDRPGDGANA